MSIGVQEQERGQDFERDDDCDRDDGDRDDGDRDDGDRDDGDRLRQAVLGVRLARDSIQYKSVVLQLLC